MEQVLYPIPGTLGRQWGFMNREGKVVIEPQFAQVGEFSEGLCWVYVGNKAGFINTKGEMVIPPQFTSIKDFVEGRSIGLLEDGNYVAIDTKGTIVNQIPYRVMGEFHAGLAKVSRRSYTDDSGKKVPAAMGYINRNGDVAIEPRFTNAGDFPEDGLAIVVSGQDKFWYYINQQGEVVLQVPMNAALDNGYGFSEGLLRVKENGWWGYKDKTGQWKLQPQYDLANDFKEGMAWVQLDGKAKYVDKYGFEVIPKAYTQLKPFSEGLALVQIDNRYGYITEWGSMAFRPRILEKADSFSEGMARIKMDGQYGYLNKQGDFAIPCQYSEARSFKNGLAFVMTKQGWAYINTSNQIVWASEPFPKIELQPLKFNFPEYTPRQPPEPPKPEYVSPEDIKDIPNLDGIRMDDPIVEPAIKIYTDAELDLVTGELLPDGTQLSPDGSYKVEYACNEMRMSHWVCAPRITHTKTGNIIFDLWNTSLWDGSARFAKDGNILIHLRKYPGSVPGFDIIIDPVREMYMRKDQNKLWLKLKDFSL
ncbi:WG repeat-containing protein [Rhodocytophaga rosea]|uniref:WG repeat-containing protein n=1 Tax=Rhodocytophaga rosea TaxID=2704465 RepID=A0A6C0GUK9_9BACT|nr:WG repeat-containing protein [Rhodocytophaga rosea]QHT71243.1 WG repeat-containing protein [Rhodocytophaga rosea]